MDEHIRFSSSQGTTYLEQEPASAACCLIESSTRIIMFSLGHLYVTVIEGRRLEPAQPLITSSISDEAPFRLF